MTTTPIIGVLGATGGIGASTLAVALSVQLAAPHRSTVCVDARPRGGGIDITWAAEHLPGLRWPDLITIEHDPDTAATLRELPTVDHVTLVSHTTTPAEVPPTQHATALVAALAHASDATVIDLPRLGEHHAEQWWMLCTHLVVLLPHHPAGVASSLQLAHANFPPSAPLWAVQRTARGRHLGRDLAASLGLTYLTSLPDHPATSRRAHAGLLPVRPRDAYSRCANHIVTALEASLYPECA